MMALSSEISQSCVSFKNIALAGVAAVFVLAGCSHKGSMDTFSKKYYQGDLQGAYKYAKTQSKSDVVLWDLQAGAVAFELGDNFKDEPDKKSAKNSEAPKDAYGVLDRGEQAFIVYEQEGLLAGGLGAAGAVLANDNVQAYRGYIYEGVLFNYYKALAAMSKGKYNVARVEFNRANDRQRRAKDNFAKDIQKAKAQMAKDQNSNKDLNGFNADANADSILSKEYKNLGAFAAYEGFINPAVSYTSGLFFMLDGDYNKAAFLYREAYGITKSKIIDEDLQIAQNPRRAEKYTWIIIEDGKAPTKEEKRFDMVVDIDNKATHIGFSLPALVSGKDFHKNLNVSANGAQYNAQVISNLDGVITNEFNKQLPSIAARAIASSVLKATAQAVVNKNADSLGAAGLLLKVGAAAYSVASVGADVRISQNMPNTIYAVRVKNEAGMHKLSDGGKKLFDLEITQDCKSDLGAKNSGAKICESTDNILYLRLREHSLSAQVLYAK